MISLSQAVAMKEISLKALDESLSLASILEMLLWELQLADWVDPSVGRGAVIPSWCHSLWL